MAKLSDKYGAVLRIDKDIKQKMQVIAKREKRSLKAVIEMACEMKINEYPTLQLHSN